MNSEVGAGEIVFDCYKYSKEPNHLFSNYRYAIFIIFYNICAWRMAGEPSGRAAWQCEHNEMLHDDCGSLVAAPLLLEERRVNW